MRDRYSQPQQVRSRQAYLLTDRRKTAAQSVWLPAYPSAKRCTLSLARIPRQRYLRADHNSTWRRVPPPPQTQLMRPFKGFTCPPV